MSCEEEVGGLMESVSQLLVEVVESEGPPTLVTIARCVCVCRYVKRPLEGSVNVVM